MDSKQDLRIIQAAYTASAVRSNQYPEGDLREIAFLGRSNVGKSSLINSLCNQRGLARVSGDPGKTRTVNFYTVVLQEKREDQQALRQSAFFVDLPGYGFARTGGKNRDTWSSFINEYVQQSQRLALLCLLVDLRHPGLPIDGQAYAWLASHGVPLQLIGTKADKLKASELKRNLSTLNQQFPGVFPAIAYSSLKHSGRDVLLARFQEVINN
jgi:GTP-binding protein